ncbi:MAG: serine hydrolase domain-containing protein [Pseudomonadota bacterium]
MARNDNALAEITTAGKTAPFSAEGLKRLEARVAQFVADGDAAAVNTVLVHKGQVVQYAQAGFQNVETQTPVSEDTIWRIYSMTKPIVGVAMMMLYEEGVFALDDPISKFVPELSGLKIVGPDVDSEWTEPAREPTMQELLAHTAGFSYGFTDDDPLAPYYREKQILGSPDLDEFIHRVSQVPLLHEPGAQWNYSVAVDIQGAIIERVTGQSLGEYLQETLFDPLGMTDTGFRVPAEDFGRMADGFMVDPTSGQLGRLSEEQISGFGVVYREGAPLFESGGFGLASTLPDYARFCQMLANGGSFNGRQFLKPETVELMRTNVLPIDQPLETPGLLDDSGKPGTGFGLNFGVVYDADSSPTPYGQGTYFWGGLASTWFWIDPEHDLYYIGMVQVFPVAAPVADFRRITADIIYADLER